MKKILLILFFVSLFLSCQKPVEPEIEIDNTLVSIKIETFEGNPIPGIKVDYVKGLNYDKNKATPFGNGFTSNNGFISQYMKISSSGEYYSFKLSTNSNLGIPQQYLNSIYTFKIGCNDSLYIIKLPIVTNVDCQETLPDIYPKKLTVCPKVKQIDTIGIGPICINCNKSFKISYNQPSKIKNSKILIKDINNNIINSNPFSLDSGSCFYAFLVFDTKNNIIPAETDKITFKVNYENVEYKLVDVYFTAESICSECDCPNNYFVQFPNDTSAVKLCLNQSLDYSIPLNKFINQNSKCELRFKLSKSFNHTDIFEFVSFNNEQYYLTPNNSLTNLKIKIKGNKLGNYIDTIKFNVQSYNPDYNLIEDCLTQIAIIVKATIVAASCEYDFSSSIFLPKTKSPDSTVTMSAGIGLKKTETIGIKNTSNCPLVINGYIIYDKSNQGRPFQLLSLSGGTINFPITIEPNTTKYFIVQFSPDPIDAYPPDGIRKNSMQEDFITKLKFISNSQSCELKEVTLRGKIISKSTNWICIRTNKNGLKVGVTFNDDGALTNDTSKYFIYIDSYNQNTNQVRIKRTVTKENKVYVTMIKSKFNAPINDLANKVCDIATINNSYCDEASSSTLDFVDVSVGDVVAFNYFYINSSTGQVLSYCTIMVVERISIDPNGDIILCFYTCTGV